MNKIKIERIEETSNWTSTSKNGKITEEKIRRNCRCLIDTSSPAALERDFYAWLNGIGPDTDISRPCLFATNSSSFSSTIPLTTTPTEESPAFLIPMEYSAPIPSTIYYSSSSSSSSAASSSSISPGNSNIFCNNSSIISSCSHQIGFYNHLILNNNNQQQQQQSTTVKRARNNQNSYKNECSNNNKVRRKRNVDKETYRGPNVPPPNVPQPNVPPNKIFSFFGILPWLFFGILPWLSVLGTTSPVDGTTSPVIRTTSPVLGITSPFDRTTSPVDRTTSLVNGPTAPVLVVISPLLKHFNICLKNPPLSEQVSQVIGSTFPINVTNIFVVVFVGTTIIHVLICGTLGRGTLGSQYVGPAVHWAARKYASGRGTNLYGRSYCPGRPLSMEERAKIIQLFHGGMKVNAISKQLCISHGCVSKIITRFRETGNLMPSSHSECRRRKRQQQQMQVKQQTIKTEME
uniref:Paired domain-containing protein n=1 Tax=Meloidogyne incognita TaxID=6306 RepID=A0A914LK89_MELIC